MSSQKRPREGDEQNGGQDASLTKRQDAGGARDGQDIMRIALEILACTNTSVPSRAAHFQRAFPEFAETHPRLFQMCCMAVTRDQRNTVMHLLSVMLAQRDSATRQGWGEEAASTATGMVHRALQERYVAPALERAEAQRQHRETEANDQEEQA